MDDHDNDWLDDLDDAPAVHTIEAVTQSDEFVEWRCSTCGRRVKVAHAGGLTVLHPGDPTALHYGGTGVRLSAPTSGDQTPPPSETIH
jgi:hypothetical protein